MPEPMCKQPNDTHIFYKMELDLLAIMILVPLSILSAWYISQKSKLKWGKSYKEWGPEGDHNLISKGVDKANIPDWRGSQRSARTLEYSLKKESLFKGFKKWHYFLLT